MNSIQESSTGFYSLDVSRTCSLLYLTVNNQICILLILPNISCYYCNLLWSLFYNNFLSLLSLFFTLRKMNNILPVKDSVQFSSVTQSCLTLCDPMNRSTPGLPIHHQLPEFTQILVHQSVMPSSHLILCHPLLLLPPIPPNIKVFSNDSALGMRWPKYWSFLVWLKCQGMTGE